MQLPVVLGGPAVQSGLVQQPDAGMHTDPQVFAVEAQGKLQVWVVALQVPVVLAGPPVQSVLVQQALLAMHAVPHILKLSAQG